MIVTFYSFKGGVGRSMAMANVGELLADQGYHVILCDWDLEAPGLERYLLHEPDSDGHDLARFQSSPGLIDLLLEFKRSLTGKGAPAAKPGDGDYTTLGKVQVRRPSSVAVPVHGVKDRSGSLRLLTAGRRDGAFLDAYAEAVRGFDWGEFYEKWGGGAYIDFFRRNLVGDPAAGERGAADILLLDSRTGVTEQGGVCTHHLADLVVLVTAANELNLQGSLWMARMLWNNSQLAEMRGGRRLRLLPVASRIEQSSEKEELVDFRLRFQQQLGGYLPETVTAPRDYLLSSEIPYMPFYSYRERVVAREPEDRREVRLYRAYKALTDAIVHCGIECSLLREPTPQGRVVDTAFSLGVPSWDEERFLAELREAIQSLNQSEIDRLCEELTERFDLGDREVSDETLKAVFRMLRGHQRFDVVRRLTEALVLAGRKPFFVRKNHALALLEQGDLPAALSALESLAQDSREDAQENAEARGLIGRVYRKLYLGAGSPARGRRYLERGVNAYLEAFKMDRKRNHWQGIEAVALLHRGQRDGLQMEGFPSPSELALDIFLILDSRSDTQRAAWELEVAAQACIALGRFTEALAWIARYVKSPEVDVFDLQRTWRQLREAWDLTPETPPGSLLLPVLQSHILSRGGRVDVALGEIGPSQERRLILESVLHSEGTMTLSWYRLGLERCRLVGRIQTLNGDGVATGFLVRGSDLDPGLGDGMLFLTCTCAIDDDLAAGREYGALDPAKAVVVFEALEPAPRAFRVGRVLWSSPPGELDAALLTLDPPVPTVSPYPIAERLPALEGGPKVYVIGHPGGRSLSISLSDNLLLDYDDRLLHYRAAAEPGSAGSPIFNQRWELIGMHHAGSDRLPRLKGQPGTYAAREGIQIRRIIEAVRAAGSAG